MIFIPLREDNLCICFISEIYVHRSVVKYYIN